MDLKPPTRRRGPELEDALLDAAWEVLVHDGYPGFTYEAVAARAGTSRPVLYRRWPRREEMLFATLRKYWWSRPLEVPDTGSLRDDALAFLRGANESRAQLMAVISVQLMDYFRDTGSSFSELREILRGPVRRVSGLRIMVRRAVQRGELAAEPVSDRVVDLPFDLFRHEMLMTMKPAADAAIVAIVDEVWLPLLHAPGVSSLAKQRDSGESA
ncbi:TetR/AcrR family transcriptional regulator [Pseudolysinimonas kribbensis]|uniref:TetR family transcriptional regulator n=1 Tax=Pseudolysinimonas kribbensis TaxID=433641 RepID=A0ABQ6K6D0_9MICO|nr:TetR/AcrR family transcriptional regulator [Pseudolysinimonas kribbensis]GMA95296.1 TetR family transcriptional regulator [Pseudolysinimonas kribbensis]